MKQKILEMENSLNDEKSENDTLKNSLKLSNSNFQSLQRESKKMMKLNDDEK